MKMFPRDNTICGYPIPERKQDTSAWVSLAPDPSDIHWSEGIDIIDTLPKLTAQDVIQDYWAVQNTSASMHGSRSRTCGIASPAVTHAIAEREIKLNRVTRKKGQYLCGWKSQARWGCDRVTSLEPVNCPQCAKAVAALNLKPSIRIKEGFWD